MARKDTGGQTALVAFLVGDADRTDTRRLSTGLRTVLPDFMVPTHWEWLPALPLTPSGKRDDKALRAVALSQAGSAAAPRRGTPTSGRWWRCSPICWEAAPSASTTTSSPAAPPRSP
ncbi:hypothetical protein ACR820_00195 [Streptomyces netropsis]